MSDNKVEEWVFDFVVQLLDSAECRLMTEQFIEENCIIFSDEIGADITERKTIFAKYKETVDKFFDKVKQEVLITEEMLFKSIERASKIKKIRNVIRQILCITNYEEFEKIMIRRNKEIDEVVQKIDKNLASKKVAETKKAEKPKAPKQTSKISNEEEELIKLAIQASLVEEEERKKAKEAEEAIVKKAIETSLKEEKKQVIVETKAPQKEAPKQLQPKVVDKKIEKLPELPKKSPQKESKAQPQVEKSTLQAKPFEETKAMSPEKPTESAAERKERLKKLRDQIIIMKKEKIQSEASTATVSSVEKEKLIEQMKQMKSKSPEKKEEKHKADDRRALIMNKIRCIMQDEDEKSHEAVIIDELKPMSKESKKAEKSKKEKEEKAKNDVEQLHKNIAKQGPAVIDI